MARNAIPWTSDPRLQSAGGRVGNLINRLGPCAPEVAEARTELRVVRATLAIEDLVASAPAPSAEQLDRLRSLLGFTGNGSSAAVA